MHALVYTGTQELIYREEKNPKIVIFETILSLYFFKIFRIVISYGLWTFYIKWLWQVCLVCVYFTFLICLTLYLKTRKSLKKQEKIFLQEYGHLQSESLKEVKQKKIAKEALSAS